jgi:hypothetical protein
MMSNGIGRLGAAAFAVLVRTGALGMMIGVLEDRFALGIAMWQTRRLWSAPSSLCLVSVLRQIVRSCLIYFRPIPFHRRYPFRETLFHGFCHPFYGAPHFRALIWLVSPGGRHVPRIVHSSAKSRN